MRSVQLVPFVDVRQTLVPTAASRLESAVAIAEMGNDRFHVIILFVPLVATAIKAPTSRDQHIDFHAPMVPLLAVHVVPSGEVITLSLAMDATDTNKLSSIDQHTEYHCCAVAAVLPVQVVPSGEVITRLVPSAETAQNRSSSADQQTDLH